NALAVLMLLAETFLLIDLGVREDENLVNRLRPSRELMEHVVRGTGLGDWCARLAAPLTDAAGQPLTADLEPRTLHPDDELDSLAMNFIPPGAELAAGDARKQLATTALMAAIPMCR